MVGWIEKIYEKMDGWMDKKIDGWLDGQKKWMDRKKWMVGWIKKMNKKQMDGWMDKKKMDSWMDGQKKYRWLDG